MVATEAVIKNNRVMYRHSDAPNTYTSHRKSLDYLKRPLLWSKGHFFKWRQQIFCSTCGYSKSPQRQASVRAGAAKWARKQLNQKRHFPWNLRGSQWLKILVYSSSNWDHKFDAKSSFRHIVDCWRFITRDVFLWHSDAIPSRLTFFQADYCRRQMIFRLQTP